MSVRYQKSDKRILGTWKSSRAKTMEFWSFKKKAGFGPKKRAEWAEILGKWYGELLRQGYTQSMKNLRQ